MGKIIGIDLGSTLSCVAVSESGQVTVIVNDEGSRTTPSVIALKNNERKVGNSAKRQKTVNPKETVDIIKRFMGLNYDDEDCQKAIKHVTYNVVNDNGKPRVEIEGRKYSPEELSSMILAKMKKIAEDYLGTEVKDAVITVPAYFSNEAREATKLAGELAGLNVKRIIAEPTSALLASNLDLKTDKKVMVVDYGGSTLDFSVSDVSSDLVEIISSRGDMFCGGSDLDKKLCDYLISEFKSENGVDLSKDVMALQRVIEASEKAKIELSSSSQTEINLPYITVSPDTKAPLHLIKTLTRAKFEQLISDELDKVISCGKEALKSANMKSSELDGILLVGGSCRIPALQDRLKSEFGVELYKTANLDECVAQGAAVQGSILAGENNDMLLLDVTPLSLSIETMGGVATKMIESNTTIPCKKENTFTTAVDNQPAVTIRVCQGERPLFSDNKIIGEFSLDNIPPAKRGIPKIEVTFDIDVNGILKVTAKDSATGKENHITIEQKGSLSNDEIERIKKEAEVYSEQDKKAKERIDKINKADSLVFQTEKQMSEFGDKLTDDEKNSIQPILNELKEIVDKKEGYDKVDSLEKQLTEKWIPISARLYSANNPQDGTSSNPFGGGFGQGFDFGDLMKNAQNFTGGTDTKPKDEPPTTDTGAKDADFEEVK